MKILITGTTGFLGRSLREHFVDQGHQVIEYRRGSVSLDNIIHGHTPDVMIHCAGEIYETKNMFRTNVEMVQGILESIKSHSPKTRLIQIGSSSEYGPMPRASAETDRINPQNLYEATKGAATLLCQGYARQYNLDVCVARIYSGYGAYERERRLFPTLYRAFFQDEPMELYDGVHDFIYIDDFVRGIDILVNKGFVPGDIINFGSGVQLRNITVLKIWEMVTRHSAPVTYHNRYLRAHDTTFWQCDTAYAEKQYGFKTEFDLEAGIREFIKKKG